MFSRLFLFLLSSTLQSLLLGSREAVQLIFERLSLLSNFLINFHSTSRDYRSFKYLAASKRIWNNDVIRKFKFPESPFVIYVNNMYDIPNKKKYEKKIHKKHLRYNKPALTRRLHLISQRKLLSIFYPRKRFFPFFFILTIFSIQIP